MGEISFFFFSCDNVPQMPTALPLNLLHLFDSSKKSLLSLTIDE